MHAEAKIWDALRIQREGTAERMQQAAAESTASLRAAKVATALASRERRAALKKQLDETPLLTTMREAHGLNSSGSNAPLKLQIQKWGQELSAKTTVGGGRLVLLQRLQALMVQRHPRAAEDYDVDQPKSAYRSPGQIGDEAEEDEAEGEPSETPLRAAETPPGAAAEDPTPAEERSPIAVIELAEEAEGEMRFYVRWRDAARPRAWVPLSELSSDTTALEMVAEFEAEQARASVAGETLTCTDSDGADGGIAEGVTDIDEGGELVVEAIVSSSNARRQFRNQWQFRVICHGQEDAVWLPEEQLPEAMREAWTTQYRQSTRRRTI